MRAEFEVKMQEVNVARLRRKKLLADLEAVKTREAYALAELELANAVREVQEEERVLHSASPLQHLCCWVFFLFVLFSFSIRTGHDDHLLSQPNCKLRSDNKIP